LGKSLAGWARREQEAALMRTADTKHLDCPHAKKLKRLQEVARLTMYEMVDDGHSPEECDHDGRGNGGFCTHHETYAALWELTR
jgi:hypothetical protein